LGANLVWLYFTAGCWMAIAAVVLILLSARAAKEG